VLSICVEICSAAFYIDDDPGVLVSACLFGDGAGAAVVGREPIAGRLCPNGKRHTITEPAARDVLRFEQKDGMLRNILTPEVPQLAAEYAETRARPLLREQRPHAREHRRMGLARRRAQGARSAPGELGSRRERRRAQQRRAARIRQREQRVRLLRAQGDARQRRAARVVVDVVVRAGFTCHGGCWTSRKP
jgi:hypothetical protein